LTSAITRLVEEQLQREREEIMEDMNQRHTSEMSRLVEEQTRQSEEMMREQEEEMKQQQQQHDQPRVPNPLMNFPPANEQLLEALERANEKQREQQHQHNLQSGGPQPPMGLSLHGVSPHLASRFVQGVTSD
ncbi:hypothetical protein PMAYCL1PPCAC_09987, partial [Pristionchus mayeri]